jgi:hypothetical protein
MIIQEIQDLKNLAIERRKLPSDNPENWHFNECIQEAGEIRDALQQVLNEELQLQMDTQDRSDFARLTIPSNFLSDPGNPFVQIILSGVTGLSVVTYDWDVMPAHLQSIYDCLDSKGYDIVSYRLFADPQIHRWRHQHEWMHSGKKPPSASCELKNEDVWRDLFDYI